MTVGGDGESADKGAVCKAQLNWMYSKSSAGECLGSLTITRNKNIEPFSTHYTTHTFKTEIKVINPVIPTKIERRIGFPSNITSESVVTKKNHQQL